MLIDVYNRVNIKFSLLRLVLYNCLVHRASIKKYHESYTTFLRYMERVHPDLIRLFTTNNNSVRIPIFPIKSKRHRPTKYQREALLPSNTIIIVGERTYFQFAAIKRVLTHLVEYEKSLSLYLHNFDNSIIRMVNGMNDFRNFFKFFLQIVTKGGGGGGGGGGWAGSVTENNHKQLTEIIQRTYSEAFIRNYQF